MNMQSPLQSQDPIRQQIALLHKYQASVVGQSEMRLTIPKGTSALDILNEGQALAPLLHKLNGVPLNAVWPSRLEAWSKLPEFREPKLTDCPLLVHGNLNEAAWKNREELIALVNARGERLAKLPHIAATHVLYFIATGQDMFDGRIIRIDGPERLYYGDGGLSQMDPYDYIDTCRYQSVRAAIEKKAA